MTSYEQIDVQDNQTHDTELNYIALDRLSKFLSSVDDKLNRLENLLSSNGLEDIDVEAINAKKSLSGTHSSSGASMRKKLTNNLYNRYKNRKVKIQNKKKQIIGVYRAYTSANTTTSETSTNINTNDNDNANANANTNTNANEEGTHFARGSYARISETSLANDLTTLYHFLKTAKDMRPNFTKKTQSPLHTTTPQQSHTKMYDDSIIDKFTTIFENYYGSEFDQNSTNVSMLSNNSSSATLINEDTTASNTHSHMDILNNLKYIHDKYTLIVSNEKELSEDLLSYSANSSTVSLLDSETLVSKHNYSTSSLHESLEEIPEFNEIIESTPEVATVDIWTQINYHNYAEACELGSKGHLHYYQLPFPWRENKYIIHGYRFHKNWKTCLKSIFGLKPILAFPEDSSSADKSCAHGSSPYHWHNETVNIWSHLCASLYMCYLLYTFLHQSHSNLHAFQKTCCALFMFMGAFCFLCSATWHTFNGFANLKQRSRACCCDYTGISLLITNSIISLQSLILWNERVSPILTGTMILAIASLGLCTVYMNWSPKFDRPESRHLRILVFVLLAALGNISFLLDGATGRAHFTQLFKNSFVYYLGGVLFYGGFIPEKFRSDVHVAREIPTHAKLCTDLGILGKERDTHFKHVVPLKSGVYAMEGETVVHTTEHKHHASFKSLWWVDYYFQSHNVWHIAVVMGCLGHYKTLMDIIAQSA